MKQITKALGIIGAFALVITTAYFLYLYPNLTQLILILGFAGGLSLGFALWVIEWMINREKELRDMNHAIDMTRDYAREHIEKSEDEIEVDKLKKIIGRIPKVVKK